jgi:hypothetical protein
MGATEDAIWNRAAFLPGKAGPGAGDTALSALLLAHGQIMNGGVLNCCQDSLADNELRAAADGYRYFGLSGVADLLTRARLVAAADAEEAEARLDVEYARTVPDDNALVQKFEAKFKEDPTQFGRLD